MKKSSPDINTTRNSPQISEVLSNIIFDSGMYMAWISEKDALLTNFNRKWLSFTGQAKEQETGYGWTHAFHPDDLARFLYKYINAFNSRREFKLKYRLRRYDGIYYWVLNHGWPVVGSDNYFLGYIGLCDLLVREKNSEIPKSEITTEQNNEPVAKNKSDRANGEKDLENLFLNNVLSETNGFSEKLLRKISNPNVTKREKEIIDLIIRGYRNKQIARILNISTNTVRNHICNIFSKFNVTNRVQLFNQIVQPKL